MLLARNGDGSRRVWDLSSRTLLTLGFGCFQVYDLLHDQAVMEMERERKQAVREKELATAERRQAVLETHRLKKELELATAERRPAILEALKQLKELAHGVVEAAADRSKAIEANYTQRFLMYLLVLLAVALYGWSVSCGDVRRLKSQLAGLRVHLARGHAEKCVVCLDSVPSVMYLQCGHMAVCQACHNTGRISRCPMCRANIAEALDLSDLPDPKD